MKRFLALTLLFLLTVSSISAGDLQPPQGFTGKLYASTLALYATLNGEVHFICIAEPFEKINGGYHLISAGHCVQQIPDHVKFFVSDDIGGPLVAVTLLKAYEGDGLDFSAFELKTKKKYTMFVLGDEHDATIGDAIINPNFAAGIGKQLSLGHVSSDVLPITSRCSEDGCAGDFVVQSYGAGGSSGSAVVDERTHRVIGLVVWGFDGILGFGVEPISKFHKFLVGPNQPHPSDDPA